MKLTLNCNLLINQLIDCLLQVKFGLSITSSEKADKEKRYCDFDLYSVPYPGIVLISDDFKFSR